MSDELCKHNQDKELCLDCHKEEIKKLKTSVDAWKDAWFQLRDIVGHLSWAHLNCPHAEKRTIDTKPNPWIHLDEQFVQEGKLVWKREAANYKLIGAGTSEEAGKAIIRLMSVEGKER